MIKVEKKHSLTGHKGSIYTIVPSQYNNIFFSGAGDGYVVSWDLKNPEIGEVVAQVPNSIYAIHYLKSINLLAIGHNYDGVHLVDWESKKEIGSINFTKAAIFDLASWRNFLFATTGDGELVVLDPEKRTVLKKIKLSDKNCRSITINESRNEVALGFSDNYIRILNLKDLSIVKEFLAHDLSVFNLKYVPGENELVSVSRDAQFKIWDTDAEFKNIDSVAAHMYAINDIQFSPDGRYFATCSMDKSIKIWDATNRKLLKVIDKGRHAGHGTSVNKLWWSEYNNWLISCSDDRTISVWQLEL